MAVITKFYNYQTNPNRYPWDKPPYNSCLPRPVAIRRYLENRWGLVYLGCHQDRPIKGGESISDHAFGAAPDMRYQDPGPGLGLLDAEIIPWLIATSAETGVQAIHHYRRSTIWRPPGTQPNRPNGHSGWIVQKPGSQMGQTWALWIHVAIHPDFVFDERPIELVVAPGAPPQIPPVTPPVITPPVTPPVLIPGQEFKLEVTLSTIRRGSTGSDVKRAQAILANLFGQAAVIGTIDGSFGPRTEDAVKNVQRFFGLADDGICGPKTWKVLIELP